MTSAVGERPSRARHLGTPGLVGVDVLQVAERPAAVEVAVPDRPAVVGAGSRRGRRLGRGDARQSLLAATPATGYDACDPQASRPPASSISSPAPHVGLRARSCRRGAARPPSAPSSSSPATCTAVATAAATSAVDGGGQGRRRVDDEEVTRAQLLGQVAGSRRARDAGRRATSSRTSSRARPRRSGGAVASPPCGSGTASPAGAQEHTSCDSVRASRWRAGPSPVASTRRPLVDQSRSSAGTTVSGSGRSEMSSSGKASWCICVRMSPGSKA